MEKSVDDEVTERCLWSAGVVTSALSSLSLSAIALGNEEDPGESSSSLSCLEGTGLLLSEVSRVEHLGSICDLTAFAVICQRLQLKRLQGPSR